MVRDGWTQMDLSRPVIEKSTPRTPTKPTIVKEALLPFPSANSVNSRVSSLAGETDFLLRIVARDWDSYNRFLTSELTAAPNVSHVKSALAIRASKQAFGVPIDDTMPPPDEGA